MKNTKAELKDNELEEVNGGIAHFEQLSGNLTYVISQKVSCNLPKINPDEKYVMNVKPTADEIISELKS